MQTNVRSSKINTNDLFHYKFMLSIHWKQLQSFLQRAKNSYKLFSCSKLWKLFTSLAIRALPHKIKTDKQWFWKDYSQLRKESWVMIKFTVKVFHISMGWFGCWFESITNIWITGGQYVQVYLTSVSLDIICILVLNALAFLEESSITR